MGYDAQHKLTCDMTHDCQAPVTHIDSQGYVYCQRHGRQRQMTERCRRLKPIERSRLDNGQTIRAYE